MNNRLYPCLWFDGKAKEAAALYCSVFDGARILSDGGMVVNMEILGQKIMALNGGPNFQLNASISFFVQLDTEEKLNTAWAKLIDGGNAMMALNKYPWNECYGWLRDQFGMTWQLMLGEKDSIKPSMLFAQAAYGRALEAISLYTGIFPEAGISIKELYGAQAPQVEGKLMFGQFHLLGQELVAMDGPGDHSFTFGEGISFVVECDSQEEIDHYWSSLTANGGRESMCGWLKDPFGVSWQIIPSILKELMSDREKAPRVMAAFLKMKKFDIEELKQASSK